MSNLVESDALRAGGTKLLERDRNLPDRTGRDLNLPDRTGRDRNLPDRTSCPELALSPN